MRYLMTCVLAGWAVMVLAGCDQFNSVSPTQPPPAAVQATATPNGNAAYLAKSGGQDTREPDAAVDTALQWAQKYSEASERLAKIQQENRDLLEAQQKLREQISRLQTEGVQSAAQLKDANAMLMEMRGELEKWKTSVLGFRQEMREAQQAQLTGLARVLKLLGAETPAVAAPAPATGPSAPEATVAKGHAE